MVEMFQSGGWPMWPVLASAIAAGVLAVRSWVRLRGAAPGDPVVETGIDAVLFWGGWGALVGVLGTVGGIVQAAGVIERMKNVPPSLVWGGIKVSLIDTAFGLVVLILSLAAWFALRVGYRKRNG